MLARLDPARTISTAGFGLLAVVIGLAAGLDPKFAIAGAIAVGFVLLVFVDLALGLALFGFFSFLELLQLGSIISVGKLGGALLALGWIAVIATKHDSRGDFLNVHPWISTVLGLFLGWSLLSMSWAAVPSAALSVTGRYALNAILFLIVFTAVRTRKQALLVAGGFLAGAVAATAYGLTHISATVEAGRLTGAGLDPNELSSVLVAGIALSGAIAMNLKHSPGLQLATIGAGAFCLLGIFLTVSRGGLVALGAATVAALLFSGRWRLRIIAAVIVIAFATLFYFNFVASPEARERISSPTQGETRVPDGRLTIWAVGWRMATANPVGGVGAGNFRSSAKDYLLRPGTIERSDQILIAESQPAHNSYLSVLAELGFVGEALFLTIIGFSLTSCVRAAANFKRRGDRESEALARAFAVALVGTLAADFFITQELNKQLWLLLGFGPALLAISRGPAEEPEPEPAAYGFLPPAASSSS